MGGNCLMTQIGYWVFINVLMCVCMCVFQIQISCFRYKGTYKLVLASNGKIIEGSWDIISISSEHSYRLYASPGLHPESTYLGLLTEYKAKTNISIARRQVIGSPY